MGFSSYFLHIPGLNGSKGQMEIYNLIHQLFDRNLLHDGNNMFHLYQIDKNNFNEKNEYFVTNSNRK
jgi:hypothetical protein